MKCHNCGCENDLGANYCLNCGIQLVQEPPGLREEPKHFNDPVVNKKGSNKLIFIMLGALLVIAIAASLPKYITKITNTSRLDNTTGNNTVDADNVDNTNQTPIEYNASYDNYNFSVEVVTKIKEISVETYTHGTVDEINHKEYFETEVNTKAAVDVNVKTKTYTDLNTGYSYTYTDSPIGGQAKWSKKLGAKQKINLKELTNKLSTAKNIKSVDNNHYVISMTSEELNKLLEADNAEAIQEDGNIDIDIYLNNGYITEIDYDFSKFVKDIDTIKVTVKISDYNKAGTVEIPQEVIDNAI